jgi:hypothetical protein
MGRMSVAARVEATGKALIFTSAIVRYLFFDWASTLSTLDVLHWEVSAIFRNLGL